MSSPSPTTRHAPALSVADRRWARKLANVNGGIWALGNGLASGLLLAYVAIELHARYTGLGVALILAAPQLVGVLRLSAPALVGRLAGRKRFCLAAYLLSGVVLLALPIGAAPGLLPSPDASLALLVVLWGMYHLLEYLGTVALWSWLGDLVPARIRGRFIGRRDRWMVSGQALGMLACGLFTYAWTQHFADRSLWWIGYAIPAIAGACLMMSAVVPLAAMPPVAAVRAQRLRPALRSIAAALADRRFLRLLAFGCWLAFANGLSVPAQNMYPRRVLEVDLLVVLALATAMRCGQLTVSPWLGRAADRLGNRPVMAASLALVATGPLFFYAATPGHPWWIAGASAMWIAFAGLNVCLPNLMLQLSPREGNIPHIAVYYTLTGLCAGLSMACSGVVADRCAGQMFCLLPGLPELDYYHAAFLVGAAARAFGLVVLCWVVEGKGRAL